MKIAFTVSGETLDSPLDKRFGRAAKFLLYDTDSDGFSVIDNQQNLTAPQGAGIQAAETIVRSGAKALITGHCGPKAFRVLTAADVAIYNTEAATALEALALFRDGKLKAAQDADVEGHWL